MMEEMPKRKVIRLLKYDYSRCGCYYVTVCTRDKQPIFWESVPAEKTANIRACEYHAPPYPVRPQMDDPVRPRSELTELIKDGTPPEMLSPTGKVVKQCWEKINTIYPNVRTDYYVIMPDHFHGIIVIDTPPVGADDPVRPSLPKIIQGFKSVTTRQCFKYGYREIWQRGYFEHIIRNHDDYINTVRYIMYNPQKLIMES